MTCGYSLTGLPEDGVCPECACTVALSRRVHDQARHERPPWPRPLRFAKIAWLVAIAGVLALPILLKALNQGRAISRSPFFAYWEWALFAAFALGLLVCIIGMRYRDGALWMLIWLVLFLAAGILIPGIAG